MTVLVCAQREGVGRSLEETSALVGRYAWVEERLFEVLGGWVSEVAEPEVKLVLSSQSRSHAWHAELWHEQLPALPHLDAATLVQPANDRVEVLVEQLGRPREGAGTMARLVGLYRVLLPRLLTAYAAHLEEASPISDGPLIRSLRLVIGDELDDWRGGERLLQGLVRTPETAERAARHQGHLEGLVVDAGGLFGETQGGKWDPPPPPSGGTS